MNGYGLPRESNWKHYDSTDVNFFGLQSSARQVKGKGGEYRGDWKNSEKKRGIRRTFKSHARQGARRQINTGLEDYYMEEAA